MKIVKLLVKEAFKEAENHERLDNEFWVTDLCRCPQKTYFEREIPELKKHFLPIYVVGNLIHLGLQTILRDLLNAEIEVKKSRTVNGYVVTGRIDALLGEYGVEIKFSQSDEYIPYEHHVLQCKIYNWLFDLTETILIYVTPQRIAEFEITDRVSDQYVVNLIENTNIPRFKWECKYCEYDIICPHKVRL